MDTIVNVLCPGLNMTFTKLIHFKSNTVVSNYFLDFNLQLNNTEPQWYAHNVQRIK